MEERDWTLNARCKTTNGAHNPDAFPEGHGTGEGTNLTEQRKFKAKCWSHCYVREQCLAYANSFEAGTPFAARFGIYGGLTPIERFYQDSEVSDHVKETARRNRS